MGMGGSVDYENIKLTGFTGYQRRLYFIYGIQTELT